MTCPDCSRARLFATVNKGRWWRRWFALCWECYKRRGDRFDRAVPFLLVGGGIAIVALGFLARGLWP